jgi:hypothetical protein
LATVVVVVWPVYCLQREGSSMLRRKTDLPDCVGALATGLVESWRGGFSRNTDRVSYALALGIARELRRLAPRCCGGRSQDLVDFDGHGW